MYVCMYRNGVEYQRKRKELLGPILSHRNRRNLMIHSSAEQHTYLNEYESVNNQKY